MSYLKEQVFAERIFKIAGREEALRVFNYPYDALEEVICNAAFHKSYDVENPIEIRITPASIEVLSFEGPMPPDCILPTSISENSSNRKFISREMAK